MLIVAPGVAHAQTRRRFEPTDLDMQPVGTLEVDAQLGIADGETAQRLTMPDFEISFGLAPDVQLEVDGAYALEGRDGARFSPDHAAPDNLWISSKIGLLDLRDDTPGRAWGVGAQLGPKVPLAQGARGAGYEALLLLGRTLPRTHLVLNLGGFVDPGPVTPRRRTTALEGGLDLDLDLDAAGERSLVAELGAQAFLSGDPAQSHVAAGFALDPTPHVELSLLALVSLLPHGDRAALLLGVTVDVALFEPPRAVGARSALRGGALASPEPELR